MLIKKYQFGSMMIGEREHHSDLKIVEGKVVPSWWRKEGHLVDVDDMHDILAAKPETLVIGRGDPGRMQVSDSLRAALASARIQLIEEPTAQAVATFNRLSENDSKVAGAFHLTC